MSQHRDDTHHLSPLMQLMPLGRGIKYSCIGYHLNRLETPLMGPAAPYALFSRKNDTASDKCTNKV